MTNYKNVVSLLHQTITKTPKAMKNGIGPYNWKSIDQLNVGDYVYIDGDYAEVAECVHGNKYYKIVDVDDIDFIECKVYDALDGDVVHCHMCQ